jgi:hypothetical protein
VALTQLLNPAHHALQDETSCFSPIYSACCAPVPVFVAAESPIVRARAMMIMMMIIIIIKPAIVALVAATAAKRTEDLRFF